MHFDPCSSPARLGIAGQRARTPPHPRGPGRATAAKKSAQRPVKSFQQVTFEEDLRPEAAITADAGSRSPSRADRGMAGRPGPLPTDSGRRPSLDGQLPAAPGPGRPLLLRGSRLPALVRRTTRQRPTAEVPGIRTRHAPPGPHHVRVARPAARHLPPRGRSAHRRQLLRRGGSHRGRRQPRRQPHQVPYLAGQADHRGRRRPAPPPGPRTDSAESRTRLRRERFPHVLRQRARPRCCPLLRKAGARRPSDSAIPLPRTPRQVSEQNS